MYIAAINDHCLFQQYVCCFVSILKKNLNNYHKRIQLTNENFVDSVFAMDTSIRKNKISSFAVYRT